MSTQVCLAPTRIAWRQPAASLRRHVFILGIPRWLTTTYQHRPQQLPLSWRATNPWKPHVCAWWKRPSRRPLGIAAGDLWQRCGKRRRPTSAPGAAYPATGSTPSTTGANQPVAVSSCGHSSTGDTPAHADPVVGINSIDSAPAADATISTSVNHIAQAASATDASTAANNSSNGRIVATAPTCSSCFGAIACGSSPGDATCFTCSGATAGCTCSFPASYCTHTGASI